MIDFSSEELKIVRFVREGAGQVIEEAECEAITVSDRALSGVYWTGTLTWIPDRS